MVEPFFKTTTRAEKTSKIDAKKTFKKKRGGRGGDGSDPLLGVCSLGNLNGSSSCLKRGVVSYQRSCSCIVTTRLRKKCVAYLRVSAQAAYCIITRDRTWICSFGRETAGAADLGETGSVLHGNAAVQLVTSTLQGTEAGWTAGMAAVAGDGVVVTVLMYFFKQWFSFWMVEWLRRSSAFSLASFLFSSTSLATCSSKSCIKAFFLSRAVWAATRFFSFLENKSVITIYSWATREQVEAL